ncbi:hypothetical protein niasHS_006717 [Heterodera schachtii]|uniref:Protein HGH1 homolog n=1 Tax=Heterodera schachtii TaxID=97005 RepID=A0ABD2JI63_HETSC
MFALVLSQRQKGAEGKDNGDLTEMEMELRVFLSDGTRPDVQLSALKLLLSLSPNSDFWGANSDALIDDLLHLFGTDCSDSLPLLLAIFINISAHSLQNAEKLTNSAPLVKRCLQLQLSNATKCVSAVQLLSNLSRFCPLRLFEQIWKHDTHFLDTVFGNANTNELPETFFGFLLLNLSTVPSAGHEIVNKNMAKLVALLGQNMPKERRSSALNILFNLSMFDDLHEPLLRDPDSLLSALLWPLIDADDRLDEEETVLLPVQLQYWEGRRDNTAESGDKVLRTLYQFCATRHGRQCLRRKGIYALMRELDRATTPRNTHKSTTIEEGRICTIIDDDEGGAEEGAGLNGHGQVLRALIGMLIRTEEDIGVTNESIRHFGSDDRQMGKEAAATERRQTPPRNLLSAREKLEMEARIPLFFNDTWQMANDANNFLEGSSFSACPHLPLVKEEEKLSNGTASSPVAPPAAFRPGTPCAPSFSSVPTSSSSSTSSCFSSPVNNSSLALPSSFPPLPPCSSSSAFLAQMAVFSSMRPELFGPLLAAASLPQRPLGPPTGVGVPSLPLRFDFNAAAAAAALHSAAPHIPIGNFGPPFRSIELVEDGIKDAPQVELEDQDLWAEFHRLVNEMIITKSGRRIFPAIKVKLSGLDKKANYYVIMDIAPWDANRWKFHNSRWTVAGKADPEGTKPLHIHPDSPASGEHWMSKGASFHRVKVTNNMTNRTEFTVLNSMHKYRPRIHIVRSNDIYSMKVASWTMVTFPETEFIAVTAYQNNLVTDKKIDHNPFAKGFRDCGAGKREKKRQLNAAQHSHALHHAHHGANNANAATVERVLQGDYSEESEESETEDGAGPSRAKRPKSGLSSSSASLSPAVAGGEERRRQCHSTANNSNGMADSFPTQHNGMGHGNQSHAAALLHHLHAAAPFAHPSASAPLGPGGAAASVPSRPFLPHPLMVFPSAAAALPPPHFFPLPNGTSVPSSSPSSSSSELAFPPHFPPAFVAHPPPLFNMQQFLFFHQQQQQNNFKKQQQLQMQMMAKRKKETEEAKNEGKTEGKREGKAEEKREEKRDKKPTPGGTKRKAQFDVDSLLGEEEQKAWKSEE